LYEDKDGCESWKRRMNGCLKRVNDSCLGCTLLKNWVIYYPFVLECLGKFKDKISNLIYLFVSLKHLLANQIPIKSEEGQYEFPQKM